MAYEGPTFTLLENDQWSVIENIIHVGVPNSLKLRGRPKKRRVNFFWKIERASIKSL